MKASLKKKIHFFFTVGGWVRSKCEKFHFFFFDGFLYQRFQKVELKKS